MSNETIALAGKMPLPTEKIAENIEKYIDRSRKGKIKIGAKSKSQLAVNLLVLALLGITAAAFITFDYQGIDFGKAVTDTLHNIKTVFLSQNSQGIRSEEPYISYWLPFA